MRGSTVRAAPTKFSTVPARHAEYVGRVCLLLLAAPACVGCDDARHRTTTSGCAQQPPRRPSVQRLGLGVGPRQGRWSSRVTGQSVSRQRALPVPRALAALAPALHAERMQVEFGYAHQGPSGESVAQQSIIVLPPVDKAEEKRKALLAERQRRRAEREKEEARIQALLAEWDGTRAEIAQEEADRIAAERHAVRAVTFSFLWDFTS
eukprot:SAG31_NODE_176_length_21334_cov_12.211067_4_plen_207_part_00